MNLILESVLGENDGGAAEGVCFDDVGADFEVASMDVEYDVRTSMHEVLVAAFERNAAKILGSEIARLNSRAHCAIKHEYSLGK